MEPALHKIADKFSYLGSIISSTESDINICIGKVETAVNRLSIKWFLW